MIKSSKEKTDLIKKVSRLDIRLSSKEKRLFQKVLENISIGFYRISL